MAANRVQGRRDGQKGPAGSVTHSSLCGKVARERANMGQGPVAPSGFPELGAGRGCDPRSRQGGVGPAAGHAGLGLCRRQPHRSAAAWRSCGDPRGQAERPCSLGRACPWRQPGVSSRRHPRRQRDPEIRAHIPVASAEPSSHPPPPTASPCSTATSAQVALSRHQGALRRCRSPGRARALRVRSAAVFLPPPRVHILAPRGLCCGKGPQASPASALKAVGSDCR